MIAGRKCTILYWWTVDSRQQRYVRDEGEVDGVVVQRARGVGAEAARPADRHARVVIRRDAHLLRGARDRGHAWCRNIQKKIQS